MMFVDSHVKEYYKSSNSKNKSKIKLSEISIFGREKSYYIFTLLIFPIIIFISTLAVVNSFLDNYIAVILSFLIIPVSYTMVFSIVYSSTPITIFKDKDRIKKNFENFTYEKLILRHRYWHKFQRIVIVFLIIFSAILVLGFQFASEQIAKNDSKFNDKITEYDNEISEIKEMNYDKLSIFVIQNIDELYFPNQYELFLNDISFHKYEIPAVMKLQLEIEPTPANIMNFLQKESANYFLKKILTEMDKTDLEKTALVLISYSEPRSIFYDSTEFKSLQNFLLIVLLIPLSMLYANVFHRFFLMTFQEYNYHLTLGCFKLLEKNLELDEIEQKKYLVLGINFYNNFIKKTLYRKINHLEQITSHIISIQPKEIQQISSDYVSTLEKEHRFKLLEEVEGSIKNTDSSTFLITDPITDKIKGMLPITIPTASAIIAIFALFFK